MVGVVANGADWKDLEGWEACMESLTMSFDASWVWRVSMRKSEAFHYKVPICYK